MTMEVMRQSGERERDLVTLLNSVDRSDSKHIIRLKASFEFKGHLCLVYESMANNMRETLQKFGKGVGLSLEAVLMYGK